MKIRIGATAASGSTLNQHGNRTGGRTHPDDDGGGQRVPARAPIAL